MMKLAIAVATLSVVSCMLPPAFAFTPPKTHRPRPLSICAASEENDAGTAPVTGRRAALATLSTAFLSAASIVATAPASASLLDEYGADPSKISSTPPPPKEPSTAVKKTESTIEPNLRSNYYYPTNKKRYLPRIKKCSDAIPEAALMIGDGDWEGAADFATKIADDTILPMKLYTSSLTGGGTNVKVSFVGEMEKSAKDFEKGQKALVKALSKKDQEASSKALEQMAEALLAYRTSGRLLGPDGGGDIPSVDEIRRSACRVQGRTFEKKVLERDARLKST
mmetsp:Transcript_11897/g.16436  ORF Transcript_11897/g.16436 Transcript_11897/m.16436 type:complete len:281 (-) Transcript_11897:88-930(-)